LRGQPGAWTLSIYAQPGARRTEILGEHDGALKLRIGAQPLEGRANAELMRFIADRLGVTQRTVSLVGGAGSRSKRLRIEVELDASSIVRRLLELPA
jgi:uncharacterized protein (TIGR00251 family)